ncbi:pyocin knob domain-containing protein [Bilophila wadsworthia]|uniref:pyocin knob domain-containing protein n=1 Tax=Bilophila wadsworthia TaxID=35833 RepID=UPI00242F8D90|nr:pyocin knob domain-containing protein [Bilophila wadsworthia]
MAVKQLPKISPIPEPPNRLVGDQERFDVLTFNSLKAQEKMVNDDLNKTLIPALNQFAVDVNASVDAAKASETSALASKNAAASSAATATTKAGEAAASATAAKASETSALASKNAAGISATAAANAQKAAEAARDEAQDLANVGYASEAHAGLAKVDGKTTQADAGGVITVKDVAIGGSLGDLASARGQIGHAARVAVADFDTFTATGEYWATWASTANGKPPSGVNGFVKVTRFSDSLNIVRQIVYRWGSANVTDWQIFTREQTEVTGQESLWSDWRYMLTDKNIGDGLTVTNGIISVPEYEGATASSAGTSGLVPPAAAGQQDMFLTGGGGYKAALITYASDAIQTLTGALTLTLDSPTVFNLNTSGGVTFTASAMARNISKLVTLNLYASAATTITWPAVKWIDKNGSAPAWGTAGAYLTAELWFTNGQILASAIYNSQE